MANLREDNMEDTTKIQRVKSLNLKLSAITILSDKYVEEADKVIAELKKLRDDENSGETGHFTKFDQLISSYESTAQKMHDNELDAKMIMAELLKQLESKRNKETGLQQRKEDLSTLSCKVADYCQQGAFITHLPQFLSFINFGIKQYHRKAPDFGQVYLSSLLWGGGGWSAVV